LGNLFAEVVANKWMLKEEYSTVY